MLRSSKTWLRGGSLNSAITCVALDVSTQCDRRCPECCAGVGINRVLQHHDWEYFERAAQVIYGVERVHLSGGEPTFHPRFAEFVPKFKDLFGCKQLSMVTDGWGILDNIYPITMQIDEIHFTRYGNRQREERVLQALSDAGLFKLLIFDAGPNMANFTPRAQIGGGKPCHRTWWLSGQVAYADGKLWGCCVAPGIEARSPGVQMVQLGGGQHLVPQPPCEKCWFSL